MIYPVPLLSEGLRLRVRNNDEERLLALGQYKVVETGAEPRYEILVDAMRAQCEVPMAAIAFVDRDRMWMKTYRGFASNVIARPFCFCSVCIHDRFPLIVEDALLDPRFRQNELVVKDPYLRSYMGYPIFTWDGLGLGSLCVADTLPRSLLRRQMKLLEKARDWVEEDLDLRLLTLRSCNGVPESGVSLHAQRLCFAVMKEQQAWEAVERLL